MNHKHSSIPSQPFLNGNQSYFTTMCHLQGVMRPHERLSYYLETFNNIPEPTLLFENLRAFVEPTKLEI